MVDFGISTNSFLCASAKLENLVHNVVALTNESMQAQIPTYSIAGTRTVLKYRMTYIPDIHVLDLITLTLSSAIVLGMVLHSWNTPSYRTGRVVDSLRFTTGFASAAQEDGTLIDANEWDGGRLEDWGRTTKLRYTVDKDREQGRMGKVVAKIKRRLF